MKKFVIIVSAVILVILLLDFAYFHMGLYINFDTNAPIEHLMKTKDDKIYIKNENGYEPFEIKGVNIGSGIPGNWSTDFAATREMYLRWFKYIQEMGANTIRLYTIQNDTFYNAFYEYNQNNPNPLYMIHGVWVNDYIQNSHRDAYSKDFYDTFLQDSKTLVNLIHGNSKLNANAIVSAGHGSYRKDISPWVIGYLLGVEWEDLTVAYTNDLYKGMDGYTSYTGKYMYTAEGATPFEVMLAKIGDSVITYETERYHEQRLIAFSNWPTTDPFEYPENIKKYFMKCAYIDVEHIKTTDAFKTGHFASYHVYPYYPDYLGSVDDWKPFGIGTKADFKDSDGKINSYKAYLKMLKNHHTIPVVISEFGVSSSRGMAQRDRNTGRNQGNMSETEQGQALADCWRDIMDVGCSGGCIFTWQDEWFKRTWNTMYAVDLGRTPYWSDYQTNEQYFGLLSFDPGQEKSICYIDGDISEWNENDIVWQTSSSQLSAKYDEKFIYFLVKKDDLTFNKETLYIPLDITPKSGSKYCENFNISFDRASDFVIVINGKDNSRVMVQERYESLRSTYSQDVYQFDTYLKENIPAKDSTKFVNIDMILQMETTSVNDNQEAKSEVYETGKLCYGNSNPERTDFNSLADFICSDDYIEIRLPWQLLNFSDPSRMVIHDDYYDGNYGVNYIKIKEIYAGVLGSSTKDSLPMGKIELKGWGNKVTCHERLKSSYYVMQNLWRKDTK